MAGRRTAPRQRHEQPFPELRIGLEDALGQIDEQLDRGRAIRDRAVDDRAALGAAQSAYSTWVEYNRDLLRRILSTDEVATDFGRSARLAYSLGSGSFAEDVEDFQSDIGVHLRRLESIRERLPLYQRQVGSPGGESERHEEASVRRVFVVHGRNLPALDRVVRLLRDLDLDPVVLREQPNQGRTIIEKVEAHTDVAYAIVLMTGDDVGRLAGATVAEDRLRARQNVVLELGFFIGRLSRKMVAALVEPEVEIPSDIDGVLYIPFDAGDVWRLLLAKEMKAAGLPVDLNRL